MFDLLKVKEKCTVFLLLREKSFYLISLIVVFIALCASCYHFVNFHKKWLQPVELNLFLACLCCCALHLFGFAVAVLWNRITCSWKQCKRKELTSDVGRGIVLSVIISSKIYGLKLSQHCCFSFYSLILIVHVLIQPLFVLFIMIIYIL